MSKFVLTRKQQLVAAAAVYAKRAERYDLAVLRQERRDAALEKAALEKAARLKTYNAVCLDGITVGFPEIELDCQKFAAAMDFLGVKSQFKFKRYVNPTQAKKACKYACENLQVVLHVLLPIANKRATYFKYKHSLFLGVQ